MSGFFTALHANCDTGQAETKQRQGARLWNLGSTHSNYHVIVVVVATPAIIKADQEIVFRYTEEVEVNRTFGITCDVPLAPVGAVVEYFNVIAIDEAECQKCVHTTIKDGRERVIRVVGLIKNQVIVPIELVIVLCLFTQVGKSQFEWIGTGRF